MALILAIYTIILLWTAGLPDWIVAYATGVAQLGIWVTLVSLIPFGSFWVSLKRQMFTEMSAAGLRTHWSVSLKSSLNIFCLSLAFLWSILCSSKPGSLSIRL